METIVQKLTKPQNLVLEPCHGIFSVAKARLLLPKYRRFIVWKLGPNYLPEMMTQLILLHAEQIIIEQLANDERTMFAVLPRYPSKQWKQLGSKTSGRVRGFRRASLMQKLPLHNLHHLNPYLDDEKSFRKATNIPAYL